MAPGSSSRLPADPNTELRWSTFPPEILGLIFTKLRTISAQIRFRSICMSWRSAAKSTKAPPGLPLLACRTDRSSTSTVFSFLSPSTGTVRSIDLPEVQGYDIRAHSAGWFVLISKNQDSPLLLNPLTRSTIRLPSTAGMFRNALQTICYAFMAPYAEDQRECAIALIPLGLGEHRFAYCRLGDEIWTEVRAPVLHILAVAYLKGRFYGMTQSGDMSVWLSEINDGELTEKFQVASEEELPRHSPHIDFFLTAMEDHLLNIYWLLQYDGDFFEIYKLDACGVDSSKKTRTVLGVEYKVFLIHGASNSIFVSEAYGCKGNCIYYPWQYETTDNNVKINVFDIDEGDIKSLPGELDHQSRESLKFFSWFSPRFC